MKFKKGDRVNTPHGEGEVMTSYWDDGTEKIVVKRFGGQTHIVHVNHASKVPFVAQVDLVGYAASARHDTNFFDWPPSFSISDLKWAVGDNTGTLEIPHIFLPPTNALYDVSISVREQTPEEKT